MEKSKTETLYRLLDDMKSVVVAYSGGVDSALLAKVAYERLGDSSIAITAYSASLSARERLEAQEIAAQIGISHQLLASHELDDERYQQNTPMRCYWCKTHIAGVLVAYADEHGYAWVVDGNNLDDIKDTRPGRKAAQEVGIRSPFIETGFTKADVRELSQQLGLPNWNKPAMACLSSRIPYGMPVSAKVLSQVEAAEEILFQMGLNQLRVRHHGEIARIEVPENHFTFVLTKRGEIVERFKEIGFTYVTLDLIGYRTGSMNEGIRKNNE